MPEERRRRGRGRPHPRRSAGRARPTQARLVAVRVLDRVERVRAFADLSLQHGLSQSGLSAPDRALATELVYGTLRWRGRLDFVLGRFLERELASLEPLVRACLRLGAYQLLFSDRIRPAAAVDESVRCVRALGLGRASGLVNAVLRKVAEHGREIELPTLEADAVAHLCDALSLPRWIAERWLALYGPEGAAALARASNDPPPLCVRANRLRCDRESLLAELVERFPEARPCRFAPDGLVLGRRGDPRRDPAFLAGRFTVQDEAAQLVVDLLEPARGERVLDVCAAPGTKTTAIAERLGPARPGSGVLALDRHGRRLTLVARAARRLGLDNVYTLERDATRALHDLDAPALRRPGETGPLLFDRILVDAPCSGLGTLRRNPDARWRMAPASIPDLAGVQRALLEQAARVLRPGGRLVYSTCTLLPEENEDLIASFLRDVPALVRSKPEALPDFLSPLLDDRGQLRCLPSEHDTDGFFAVRLERPA